MSGIVADPLAAAAALQERSRVRGDRAWRIGVFAFSLLFAIGWTLALGKDVHWDAVNYHLYLGFSALNDRFALDFFGAGTPSYLNPYAYVPLYLMVRAEMPALTMAVAFASFHALILWLTYELALVAGLRDPAQRPHSFALLAVVLAAVNPVLLQGLGSTIVDLSTGVFVVGAWLLLARAIRGGGNQAIVLAGILAGVAAALKLSNALFAVAAFPMMAFLPGAWVHRLRAACTFGVACGLAFTAVALPWSLRLWEEFRNPFFPFFNQWFASPDFTDASLRYERFLADGWTEFLIRPLRMLEARGMVHTEPRAPDVRYLALVVALVLWGATMLRRALGTTSGGRPASTDASIVPAVSDADANRVLAALLCGIGTAWVLWLASSGNSRYFVPGACVAGAALALVVQRLYRYRRDIAVTAAALIVGIQIVQLGLGFDGGRDGQPWAGRWIDVRVPDRFRDAPHLYLSVAYLSGSAFVPYLHPRSGLMNITGFNPLGPGRPGGERAQALIDRNIDRVRLLIPLPASYAEGGPLPGPPEGLTMHVRRFGLRVDPRDCETMKIEGNLRGTVRREAHGALRTATYFLTCGLVAAPEQALAYAREVREVDLIFDRIEDTCPNLFHPGRPVTEQLPMWVRVYNMGSELQLWIEQGKVQYWSPVMRGDPIEIGTVDEWARGPRPIDCSRKSAPAFGGLID